MNQADAVFVGTQMERGRMRVDRIFKGQVAAEVEARDGLCDGPPYLRVGGQYLTYASKPSGGLYWIGPCGQSRYIEEAGPDLIFLELYAAGKTRSEIRGRIMILLEDGRSTPAAETPLTLRGDDATYEARTNQRGEYMLIGGVPGKYRIEVRAPRFRQIDIQREGILQEGTALRLDAILQRRNEISGPQTVPNQ